MTAAWTAKGSTLDNLNLPKDIELLSGPEKLMICVDSSCFTAGFKQVLKNFLEIKNLVNKHEVSLALLANNDVNVMSEFTSDIKAVFHSTWDKTRNSFYPNYSAHKETFDLNKIFQKVISASNSFRDEKVSLRVIIVYARVDCLPIIEDETPLHVLRTFFPSFTLDVLYMPMYSQSCDKSRKKQERQNARDTVEAFKRVCDSRSYMFAVEDNSHPFPYIMKFLAHPVMRECQNPDWFKKPVEDD